MKKQWALIVLATVLFTISADTSNAAQKRGHSAAAKRRAATPELAALTNSKKPSGTTPARCGWWLWSHPPDRCAVGGSPT